MPVIIRTPMSEDAPFGEEDARFWDWVAAILIMTVVIGVVVAVVIAMA
jgi:hypothetical protein